ncbi:hypothetical protein [Nocardioides sp.]|uniref:hypothetical protein n=1 Tax=Nocardioides sp. TaxID=35761 RepID=UPI003D0BBDBD
MLEERVGFFLLPVLRDRVVDVPDPLLAEEVRDVLELREPGGEDVRVAMLFNLSHSPTSHMDHRCVSLRNDSGALEAGVSSRYAGEHPLSVMSSPR